MSDFDTITDATAEIDTLYEFVMNASDELVHESNEVERERLRAEIDYANACIHAAEVWVESRN
jgi:hypothetical protein